MAAHEARDWPSEETVELERPAETDLQRLATDSAAWGRPVASDDHEPDQPAEVAEPSDNADRDGPPEPSDADLDAAGWGRAARLPQAERIDREALREGMFTEADADDPDLLAQESDAERDERIADARDAVDNAFGVEPAEARTELPPPIGERDAELADHEFTEHDMTPIDVNHHANGAYEVDYDDGERSVYKPAEGEVPLREDLEAGEYWRHEVAAYQVDQMLGFDLVPPTAAVDGPNGEGSVQAWVDDTGRDVEAYSEQDQQMMGVLDYVLGNTDRHGANYRTQEDGRPSAIDNGLSLPNADHDIMYSEFASSVLHTPLDQSIVEKVNAVDDATFTATLRRCGIEDAAIERALGRLHETQSGQVDGEAWDGPIVGRHRKFLK